LQKKKGGGTKFFGPSGRKAVAKGKDHRLEKKEAKSRFPFSRNMDKIVVHAHRETKRKKREEKSISIPH